MIQRLADRKYTSIALESIGKHREHIHIKQLGRWAYGPASNWEVVLSDKPFSDSKNVSGCVSHNNHEQMPEIQPVLSLQEV